jgi:hypothetical protein
MPIFGTIIHSLREFLYSGDTVFRTHVNPNFQQSELTYSLTKKITTNKMTNLIELFYFRAVKMSSGET